jgi:hypothetical protein
MKKIAIITLIFIASISYGSTVRTYQTNGHWQLLVDGQPYIIHGVGYNSTATGQNPNVCTSTAAAYNGGTYYPNGYWDWMIQTADHVVPSVGITTQTVIGPYLSYDDKERTNNELAYETTSYGALGGDFAFMKAMNVNTIRIYTHASDNPVIQSCYSGGCEGALLLNHTPNLAILRDMFNNYGIRYAIGDELGAYAGTSCIAYPGPTDYTNATQLAHMSTSVKQMVLDFKNEPGLLMYILGNENNYDFTLTNASSNPQAYYTFVDSMVVMMHGMDPNHPVAISNGETQFIDYISSYAPHLDIVGINSYRNPGGFTGFGTLFQDVSTYASKPVMLTEFGMYFPGILPGGAVKNDSIVDGNYDAAVRHNYWCDIQNHTYGFNSSGETPQNAIGGFNYEWLDEWWQGGDANNFTITASGAQNEGAQGISAQGAGINSPYARQFRPSYYMYQRMWSPNASYECSP